MGYKGWSSMSQSLVKDELAETKQRQKVLQLVLEDLTALLVCSPETFWDRVRKDASVGEFLDSFLRNFPRSQSLTFIHARTEDLHPLAAQNFDLLDQIADTVFSIYQRLVDASSFVSDDSKESIADLLYKNWIFDIPKLIDLCVIYGPDYADQVQQLVEAVFTLQPLYFEDFAGAFGLFCSLLSDPSFVSTGSESARELVFGIFLICRFSPACIDHIPLRDFISSIDSTLNDKMDVEYRLNCACLVDLLVQRSGIKSCAEILELFDTGTSSCLLQDMNCVSGYASCLVDHERASSSRDVLASLLYAGSLPSLNLSLGASELRKQVSEENIIKIQEMFPEVSRDFSESCLSTYNDDYERTVNSILEGSLPPLLQKQLSGESEVKEEKRALSPRLDVRSIANASRKDDSDDDFWKLSSEETKSIKMRIKNLYQNGYDDEYDDAFDEFAVYDIDQSAEVDIDMQDNRDKSAETKEGLFVPPGILTEAADGTKKTSRIPSTSLPKGSDTKSSDESEHLSRSESSASRGKGRGGKSGRGKPDASSLSSGSKAQYKKKEVNKPSHKKASMKKHRIV